MIRGSVEIQGWQTFVKEGLDALDDPREKSKYIRAMVFRFISEVVPLTPVDMGQARAGWTAASGKIPGVSAIRIGGHDRAKEELGRRQGQYKEHLRGDPAKFGAEVFNGVPHIVYLELGSSDQAPAGMVRVALRKMMRSFIGGSRKFTYDALKRANDRARAQTGLKRGLGPRGVSWVDRFGETI